MVDESSREWGIASGAVIVVTVDISSDDAVFCRLRGWGGGISLPESSLNSPSLMILGRRVGRVFGKKNDTPGMNYVDMYGYGGTMTKYGNLGGG